MRSMFCANASKATIFAATPAAIVGRAAASKLSAPARYARPALLPALPITAGNDPPSRSGTT